MVRSHTPLNPDPCLPSKIHDSEGQCTFHRGTLERLRIDIFQRGIHSGLHNGKNIRIVNILSGKTPE